MFEKLRTLIWYSVLLIVAMVLYHLASTYGLVLVDRGVSYMKPTIEGGGFLLIDRRVSAVRALGKDDLIVFDVHTDNKSERFFGRVVAEPGSTVSARDGRLLVNNKEVADVPRGQPFLATGVIVPRDTVFIVFDAEGGKSLRLSHRLVPYRNISGRILGK